jgi:hypothetical protein
MFLGNVVLSAYQEKIPARNAIYAHALDLSAGDELLLAILKAFIPLPLNKQQTIDFPALTTRCSQMLDVFSLCVTV